MTRIRVVGLCLFAAFAIAAVASASASAALPEFGGPFPKPFTSKSKKSTFETVKGTKVTCTVDTNAGEITGPKTGTVTVRFTGCRSSGLPCQSKGAAPEEIVTNVLSMTLGYISKAKKEVGIDLSSPTGAPLVEFECAGFPVQIRGSVIGRITPVNKKVTPPKPFLLKFAQTGGKQKITKFEAGPISVLEGSFGGPFEEVGFASTDELTFAEVVEIKA
jgi:hypothetical protein